MTARLEHHTKRLLMRYKLMGSLPVANAPGVLHKLLI